MQITPLAANSPVSRAAGAGRSAGTSSRLDGAGAAAAAAPRGAARVERGGPGPAVLSCPVLSCPALPRGEYPPGWGRTRRRFPRGTGRAGLLHPGHVAVGSRDGSPAVSPSPAQHQPGSPGADPARSCFGREGSSGPGRVLGSGGGGQPVPSPAVGGSPAARPALGSRPGRRGRRSRGAFGALCNSILRKSKRNCPV